jgi:hypothetical protein
MVGATGDKAAQSEPQRRGAEIGFKLSATLHEKSSPLIWRDCTRDVNWRVVPDAMKLR